MLLRLVVSNFLSIDEPVEFSMEASKESLRQERVAEVSGRRVLQISALWGANASGKSNFCRVLSFAQHLVVMGTRPERSTGRVPFRLRKSAADEPSSFEFDIAVQEDGNEKLFRYAFAVTGRLVVSESLVEIRKASLKSLFARSTPLDGPPQFTLDWWAGKGVSEDKRQFVRFVAQRTRPNQLFLHEAMDANVPELAPVFRWFRDHLVVLEAGATTLPLDIEEENRGELRDFIADLLRKADTGITGIRAVEVPVESLPVPPKEVADMMDQLKDGEGGMSLLGPARQRLSVFRKNGRLTVSRIVTLRRGVDGDEVPFEMMDESDGTLRLFDVGPSFHDLSSPTSRKVYVIDELDLSMHTHLTEALLQLYFAGLSKTTRSQLLFTTHDVELMSQRLFRRDEIWFIGRDAHGASCMESLSDYKDVRHDTDIGKAYLEGRYSGVPHLKPFGVPVRSSGESVAVMPS